MATRRVLVDGTNTTVDTSTDGEVAIDASGGGGGGSLTVKEAGSTVDASVTTLDFGAGFDLTESPEDEINVELDLSEYTGADLPISAGGTGASTAADAFTALKQAASAIATGVVELATDAETLTGTDTARAVTPANVAAVYIGKALADANSILYATTNDTPAALTVAASRIVGRKASGDIAAMTGAETYALLTRTRELYYSVPGTLTTGGGAVRIPFARAATITNVAAHVGTAPTGAAIRVDVNKNGTTIFTTQGNRPEIAVSTNADNTATPDVTSIAANDYLTVDIDVIGSSTPGSDLTVRIDYTETG